MVRGEKGDFAYLMQVHPAAPYPASHYHSLPIGSQTTPTDRKLNQTRQKEERTSGRVGVDKCTPTPMAHANLHAKRRLACAPARQSAAGSSGGVPPGEPVLKPARRKESLPTSWSTHQPSREGFLPASR
ncbi:uncharacterized protein PGTG_17355 [Puccinia graminis f. sp. tritici CRL 75-36-700-3]|uniref:Uncharacterized protein n=1 Tax=Puccinia graminis f. sp. tritici (strain CRL 75-36-700-3 / race SCCL) TaxID=418459 RepID=E3L4C4_PUCGT|nr:uncharacterized protein PGTG_17355 [Puccinia graminis f. sp. tritici CRL 75-36-700-3]EFP91399.1 hypothetical protein PGTG_17355 [Puccinia graminis f. sp. tritici CRL 75-36-700-3]